MHYKDGTPATIGDVVKEKTYNQPNEVVGLMISITPESDTCNCKVAYIEITPYDKDDIYALKKLVNINRINFLSNVQGDIIPIILKEDYSQCDNFIKVV